MDVKRGNRSPGLHLIELAAYEMIVCVVISIFLTTIVLILAANAIKRAKIREASKTGAKKFARKEPKLPIVGVTGQNHNIEGEINFVEVEENINRFELLVADRSTDVSDETRERIAQALRNEKAKLMNNRNMFNTIL